MGSSGDGPLASFYLDPDHVFAFVISYRPRDLFRCSEKSWTLYWAKYAWAHAASSRLCTPQMAGNLFDFSSDPVLRDAAMLNQLSASSSSTPAATFPPQQENFNGVVNFPTMRVGTLNRTSAFNMGARASEFVPWGTDSTLALAFAKLSLGQLGSEQLAPMEFMQNPVQNNYGIPAVGVPSLRQPGLAPHRLLQNGEVLPTVDIEGKKPASVLQQTLRVHVACLISDDGTTGAAGLLIKKGTSKFVCASYFLVGGSMEPALFATACCEGIKIAQAYQPALIVLESHLFYLLDVLHANAPCSEMEELTELLDPSRCTMEAITEGCNGAARRLATHCLQTGATEIFFYAPPDWLVLT
ncbi:uncharacterized protein LOC100822700 isoform X4 [Brachypodium distachyon]|uniref:uncharacterized protein LOC100822700 isoform X4 n=1 Tax=Brachypodium distachyon TaxID=15368 RepID=UPI00071DD3F7|nr:uncharacterized protein LOC100822700 isoform X4 [Brachypodium distachyon]|eukprot:XP_014756348.1 uncharacterized protein LOC100822700 isoform X4 [Brachypodium distachyon]